jgi:hypothetical protein
VVPQIHGLLIVSQGLIISAPDLFKPPPQGFPLEKSFRDACFNPFSGY